MADSYVKIDDKRIQVATEKVEIHNIDMLKKKHAFISAELAKVEKLIEEAGKLGVLGIVAQEEPIIKG